MISNRTKTKEHLLNSCGLNCACCELFTGRNVDFVMNFFIYIYIYKHLYIYTYINIYISKSVDIYNLHTHLHIYIYFKVCICIYNICTTITQEQYEYSTILHLTIQLNNITMYICIYRILSNLMWGNMNIGQYYS